MVGVLFDFDGVVVQSEPLHLKTFIEVLAPWNISLTNERWYREFAGTGSRHILSLLIKENNLSIDVDSLVAKRKKLYEEYVRKGDLQETPGVRSFLKDLRAKKIKTAIVSGSHRSNVELALTMLNLGEYFDLIVSGDDLSVRKPDPYPFLYAAGKLGLKPKECIAIEDSLSGMLSVKRANMRLVCVRSQNYTDFGKCDRIIPDFRGISISELI